MTARLEPRPGSLAAPVWALAAPLAVGAAAGGVAAYATGALAPQRAGLVLIGLLAPALALVVGNIQRFLLGAIILDIPFQWDKNLHYDASVAKFSALGGWSVSLTTIALVGLYAIWVVRLLSGDPDAPRLRRAGLGIPFVFLALMGASIAVATNRTLAGIEVALLAQMFFLFVYVAAHTRTRADLRFVVILTLVALLLESTATLAIYASGQAFHAVGISTHTRPGFGGREGRVGGTIGSPNEAGSYFGFMVVFALAIAASRVGRGLRLLAGAAALVGFVALVLTLSRGAWLGFAAALVVLLVGSRAGAPARPAVSRGAIVAAVLLLIALAVPFAGALSARVFGNDYQAAAGRIPLIHLALQIIANHPLLGIGANNFAVVAPNYAAANFSSAWFSTVHNKYLLVATEAGIGALLAFVAFLLASLRRAWRARRSADPIVSGVGLGLTAALVGLAVHMNFDIFIGRPMTEAFWFFAAVLLALARRREAPA